jgi:Fe-S cluster biosynthesis and repair protein YggX
MSVRKERATESDFSCTRCGRADRERLAAPPFPDELGGRLVAEICAECWEEWKSRQMLLINHYGLKVRDPEARRFLIANLRAFLFGEGDGGAEIDTSREGEVRW